MRDKTNNDSFPKYWKKSENVIMFEKPLCSSAQNDASIINNKVRKREMISFLFCLSIFVTVVSS